MRPRQPRRLPISPFRSSLTARPPTGWNRSATNNIRPDSAFGLLFRRPSLSGSPIGGIPDTQEILDFCGAHNITADVEVIHIQKGNEAYERLLKADVKYRFSIDMASLKSE